MKIIKKIIEYDNKNTSEKPCKPQKTGYINSISPYHSEISEQKQTQHKEKKQTCKPQKTHYTKSQSINSLSFSFINQNNNYMMGVAG